jgi:hypothetical protein
MEGTLRVKAFLGKKKGSTSEVSAQQAVVPAPNARVPCQEHIHPDDEEISPNDFPWAEIFPTSVGANFDPNFMNIFLARVFSKSHHMKGEGAKTKKDFQKFKTCFCLDWILIYINGAWYWVRCGHMFNLYSQGCISHPRASHKDGPNSIYPLLHNGKSGSWKMIKNLNVEEGQLTGEEICAKLQADADALCELMAVAASNDESTEQLEEAHKAKTQLIAETWARIGTQQRHAEAAASQSGKGKVVAVAAPVTAADSLRSPGAAPVVYGAWRRAGNSAAGNQFLDQKQAALHSGRNKYRTNAQWQKLATVAEEGQLSERKRSKKNQATEDPEDGLKEL